MLLPEGAKAAALEIVQWEADQREQRRLAEQADQVVDAPDDEIGTDADRFLDTQEGDDLGPLPSSAKSTPKSVAPALDLRYVAPDGKDPKGTRRNPLESNQGTGTGTDGSRPRRLPAKASDMLAWAQENG